jgi:hypothetical protein
VSRSLFRIELRCRNTCTAKRARHIWRGPCAQTRTPKFPFFQLPGGLGRPRKARLNTEALSSNIPPTALAVGASRQWFCSAYFEWDSTGAVCTLVSPSWCPRPPMHEFQTAPAGLPEVVPHPGPRNRVFVDLIYKRPHRSKALAVQIPNPGSVSRRAKREILDFLPPPPCRVPIGALLKASYRPGPRNHTFVNQHEHRALMSASFFSHRTRLRARIGPARNVTFSMFRLSLVLLRVIFQAHGPAE